MQDLKELSLEAKDLFDSYLWQAAHNISDFSFTNMFIWNHVFPVKYTLIDDYLCTFVKMKNKEPYALMPSGKGNLRNVLVELINMFKQNNIQFCMKGITKDFKQKLEKFFPDKFIFTPTRNTFDYVYLSEDLINLKGKKYHSKRNHINKFKKKYEYTYEPLSGENIADCVKFAIKWYEAKAIKKHDLVYEKEAVMKALSNYSTLSYKGGLVKVDEEVVAFSIGEQISDNMAVIHIEKADTDYSGSYAIINQHFCENQWSNVKYINREEDMGIKGLRRSKQSYKPVKLIEKYSAYLNNENGDD